MLILRLARAGKRGYATFRVVVTEHTRPPKSGAREVLGSYDPHTNVFSVDAEKVKTYLAHGAKTSPTVHNLLVAHAVIPGEKRRVWKPKKKAAASSPPASAPATSPAPVPPPPGTPPA